jgi:hypothetical protein
MSGFLDLRSGVCTQDSHNAAMDRRCPRFPSVRGYLLTYSFGQVAVHLIKQYAPINSTPDVIQSHL